jgi:hypothetical protein
MKVAGMSQRKATNELDQVETDIADVMVNIADFANYRKTHPSHFGMARIEANLKSERLTLRRLHHRRETLQRHLEEIQR